MALNEFLLRWLDSGSNVRDLQITPGSDDGYRLSVVNRAETQASAYDSLAVPVGNTVVMTNQTLGAPLRVSGFSFVGSADAEFIVTVNGDPILDIRTDLLRKSNFTQFAAPFYLDAGVVLEVTVTNKGTGAADYRSILYSLV